MRNQFVILAAGKGTRMGGNVPKVLVMLKNKPLILYTLEEIEKINQLAKPVVVVGYGAEKVKTILGDGYLYALQEQQLGTAHALLSAKRKVKADNIVVLYGDMPFIKAESLKQLIVAHFKNRSKISMLTATVKNFSGVYSSLEHFGRIVRDNKLNISAVVEFKDASKHQRKIKEVNPGIYMFNTKWLWENLAKVGNSNAQKEYYLTDIIALAIADKQKVSCIPVDPKEVLGINSREDLGVVDKILRN
ncbi:MAG: NTP transferase domain-containing protein [Candidatus Doudnabacteria bacterium]|jgi:bifunctional UDP-N-acetylglucosamine pyrophosphorylase/glucosamine-1-phosphate N-acetyltransferase